MLSFLELLRTLDTDWTEVSKVVMQFFFCLQG
jgi:hypothetical protein